MTPDTLDRRTEGFVLAAVTTLGDAALPLCTDRSTSAVALARRLLASPEAQTAARTRLDLHPPRLDAVHPSWYTTPPASTSEAARAWLERLSYGHLEPPLEKGGPTWQRSTNDAFLALLGRLGCRRMAVAFSAAPRAALAQLCARLGEPAGTRLIDEIRQIPTMATTPQIADAQRAVSHRAAWLFGDERGPGLFCRVGAAWLGPALMTAPQADRGLLVRTAQRLPRPLGELLIEAGHTIVLSDDDRACALSALAELEHAP